MKYYVDFPSKKRPGTIVTEEYETLTEAVRLALIHYEGGKFPSIRAEGAYPFNCAPMCANKWAARPVLQFWFKFVPNGIYKSLACRTAEDSGVRYASHRAGYRGSLRATRAFAADWDAFTARALPLAA